MYRIARNMGGIKFDGGPQTGPNRPSIKCDVRIHTFVMYKQYMCVGLH